MLKILIGEAMLFDFEKEKEILKKITDSLNLCCQCL